ncbi:hypothetical protein DL93DRAFT_2166540 [Clavulina sp. PMI_390]|nr:hypothetical protein DL93DRAFT_2166540 [Clavulina sp. PMI_390]
MNSPIENYSKPLSSESSQPGMLSESLVGSINAVQEFLINDPGSNVLILPELMSSGSKSVSRTPSGPHSLTPVASLTSIASAATAVLTYGVVDLSLVDFCDCIDDNQSLQQTVIVSSECYSERVGAVTHRFILLELRRPRRKDVWLRLDRRRGEKISVMKLLAMSSATKPNDRGMLSATKELLVKGSFRENTQMFENSPNLARFSRLLRVIAEEIVSYHIWPENCWFFCSLIQQHLEGAETGWFVNGNLKYATLAREIRIRISSRVLEWEEIHTAPQQLARTIEVPRFEISEGNASVNADVTVATLPERTSPSPNEHTQNLSSTRLRILSPLRTAYEQQPESRWLPPPGAVVPNRRRTLPATSGSQQISSYASESASSPLNSIAQLSENNGPSHQNLRPRVPYEGPSTKLIEKLNDLNDDETIENKRIKAKIKTALELAPSIFIVDTLQKSIRKRASKFIDVIDDIDTFLGNSSEREPHTLLFRTEAVRLQRALYMDTPLASQGELARLLRNQALALHRHNRDEEACVIDEEALTICREGYRVRPSENRARLAGILHTYSIHLYSIKRLEEALSTNEEAVVLRRLLYSFDPDEYIEPLASSLENLGVRRWSVQRFEDAKLAEEEALVLRRIMYKKDQEKNRKALADCLHNYSITLDDLGLPKEWQAAQAELDILRPLMEDGNKHTLSYSASTNTLDDESVDDSCTFLSLNEIPAYTPYIPPFSFRSLAIVLLQELFIDDDGNQIMTLPEPTSTNSKRGQFTPTGIRSLARAMSHASLVSVASAVTMGTVVPAYGMIDLSLADVCRYIDNHQSLQQAYIVSSECYAQKSGAFAHRFVVLELRRPRRKAIWLRLDRRRDGKVPIMKFLARLGVTNANDRGVFSASKEHLIGGSSKENTQAFANPPKLAELGRLLRIITEEIVSYRIWPENSWFFCSLIQQHLDGALTGWFVSGDLKYSNLANDIRTRVSSRAWDGRKIPAAHQQSVALRIEALIPAATEADTSVGGNGATATLPNSRPSPQIPNEHSSTPLQPSSPLQAAYDLQVQSLSSSLPGATHEGVSAYRRAPPATLDPQHQPFYYVDATPSSFESNVQLSDDHTSSPHYPRPHIPYEGPSPELVGSLYDLYEDETLDDEKIKAQVLLALELAPNVSIIDTLPKSMRKRAYKFIGVIEDIGTFLDNSPARESSALLFHAEAVCLQRALFMDTPMGSQGILARLLRFQAVALHKLKQDDEACVLDEEALAIRREVYRLHPGAEQAARLATTLHIYASHLRGAKRRREAVSKNEEAVVLRRMLYEDDPDGYIWPLSLSLSTLGIRFKLVQRFEDAKIAEEEALVLRRIMYDKDQEKNLKALADCLHNYSTTLGALGLPEESRAAQAEHDTLHTLMDK